LAQSFHSYGYWKKYLDMGETVLCSGHSMSWNILVESDKILKEMTHESLYLSEWEMDRIVEEKLRKEKEKRLATNRKFGL
jgi:hypothetical protein